MLVARSIASVDRVQMANRKRPRPGDGVPPDVKEQEGTALHKLWERHKWRSQAAFLATLDLSPGYLPQFFSGSRPLYPDLANAIAAELKVDVAAFSPRLARELDKELTASEWPFKRFTRAQYAALSPQQKEAVEATVVAFLPEVAAPAARKIRRVF